MKSNLSIILSIISLIGVISVCCLWIFNSFKISVITLDTFVGIIVAILALIFTVIIGYQIINALELRNTLKQITQRQRVIEENEQNFIKLANNLQAGNCNSTANSYYSQGNYFEAFVFYHSALLFAILADQPKQMGYINQLNNILLLQWRMPITNIADGLKQIELDSINIRNTTSYRNCFSQDYESVINQFNQKIKSIGIVS